MDIDFLNPLKFLAFKSSAMMFKTPLSLMISPPTSTVPKIVKTEFLEKILLEISLFWMDIRLFLSFLRS